MSYKPDERDWMAYLYGELEGEDKERFEQYLLHSPEAQKELMHYRNFRAVLSAVEDKEVIAPPIFVGEGKSKSFFDTPYIKTILAIAASLAMLIVLAKVTDVQVRASGNEFRLTFGEPVPSVVPAEDPAPVGLTEQQVKEMIQASLANNNAELQASLKENEEKLTASIRKNLAVNSGRIDELVRQASTASQEQVRSYVASMQSENMEMVKNYFQLTSSEQKKYMENLLVDFAEYLQQQRNNDLQLVQSRLKNIEQNTDIFKQETEQILTSIITTVGTTSEKEIKN
jgi:hypothetical protein